jgi:hypothetical protein
MHGSTLSRVPGGPIFEVLADSGASDVLGSNAADVGAVFGEELAQALGVLVGVAFCPALHLLDQFLVGHPRSPRDSLRQPRSSDASMPRRTLERPARRGGECALTLRSIPGN